MTRWTGRFSAAVAVALLPVLAGCAGDMTDAQDSAKKAASFVGKMQRAMTNAVEKQNIAQEDGLAEAERASVSAETYKSSASTHRATWDGAKAEDSVDLYKAMQSLTPADDLVKTAPFVIMTPPPTFETPVVDDKALNQMTDAFNKLSQGMSPLRRINELLPYLQAAAEVMDKSNVNALQSKAVLKDAVDLNSVSTLGATTLVNQERKFDYDTKANAELRLNPKADVKPFKALEPEGSPIDVLTEGLAQ